MDSGSLKERIRPSGARSLWVDTAPETAYPTIEGDIEADVAVIGGGIGGLAAAMLLKSAGRTVAVLEMDRIAKGATGYTTAKISSLQGCRFSEIARNLGDEGVAAYASASQASIDQIEKLIGELGIDCDFVRVPSYTFTERDDGIAAIDEELEVSIRAGVPVSPAGKVPLPFSVKRAIRLENQAQFHPRKFLLALAKAIDGEGSAVFEGTRALSVEDGKPCVVKTNRGSVRARDVVVATHFPFFDKSIFSLRLYPHFSYALALRVDGPLPDGMFYSTDGGGRGIRGYSGGAGSFLIPSGMGHKTGEAESALERYRSLLAFASARFDVRSVDYYWSTEDYSTPDSMPYIGSVPGKRHTYVATGFGGWGMTNGVLAGMVISDTLLELPNKYGAIFSPSRINAKATTKALFSEGPDIAKNLIFERFSGAPSDAMSIPRGEGMVLKDRGAKKAVYRDEGGEIHEFNAFCPHMGCLLSWNDAEKTWDCPCHGSRFSCDGKLLHGPAVTDLPRAGG